MPTVATIAELKQAEPADSALYTVTKYYGGASDATLNLDYKFKLNVFTDQNGGSIIANNANTGRFFLIGVDSSALDSYGYFDWLWFGAGHGDYTTVINNNQLYINNSINAAVEPYPDIVGEGLDGYAPYQSYGVTGVYTINSNILINEKHNGLSVIGQALNRTTLDGKPVVDESNSVVLRRQTSATGRFNMFYIGKDPDKTLENITVKNIAINGSRDSYTAQNGDGGTGILLYRTGSGGTSSFRPVNNVLLENIGTYNNRNSILSTESGSNGGGVLNAYENVTVKEIIIYNNDAHGITAGAQSRYTHYEDLIVRNCGHHAPSGFYGIDVSGGESRIIRDFEVSECSRGMKVPNVFTTKLVNGNIHDNDMDSLTTGGGGTTGDQLVIDNVVVKNNGRAGFRLGDGQTNMRMIRGTADNCGIETGLNWNNAHFYEPIDADVYVSQNYNGDNAYATTALNINNFTHYTDKDNQKSGLRIIQESVVKIRHGRVSNIANTGIVVTSGTSLRIYHTMFSGGASPLDIDNSGTLVYGGLSRDGGNAVISGSGTEVPVTFTTPTGLSPNTTGQSLTPTLTCNRIADATSYVFVLASDSALDNVIFAKEVDQPGSGDPSVVVKNILDETILSVSTTYYFGVYAIDESDPSASNWEISTIASESFTTEGADITPAKAVMTTPAHEATGVSTNPTYAWDNLPNAESYQLRVGTSLTNNTVGDLIAAAVTGITDTSITQLQAFDFALNNNTIYYVQVRGYNSQSTPQEGEWSDAHKFTTEEITSLLPPPGDLSPVNKLGLIDFNRALSGTSVDGATGYRVQLSTDEDFATTIVDDATLSEPSYTLNLDPDTYEFLTLYWRMLTINELGQGDWSLTMEFTLRTLMQKSLIISVESNTDWNVEPDTSTIVDAVESDNNEYIYTTVKDSIIILNQDTIFITNDKTGAHIFIGLRKEEGAVKANVALREDTTERASWNVDLTTSWQVFALHLTIAEMESITAGDQLRLVAQMVNE